MILPNETSEITVKIGGEAGFGIMVSGITLAKTCIRAGLHVFTANEYPSLIRGGHNTETIRIAPQPVGMLKKTIDHLIALNKETIDLHKHELTEGGSIIYDNESYELNVNELHSSITLFGLPLLNLAKQTGGDILMRNTVALGALMAVVDLDLDLLHSVLRDQFRRKGDAIVEQNIQTALVGYEYIKNHYPERKTQTTKKRDSTSSQILLTGCEAVGLAAVAAGMKFFAAYPMTPINGLLHYLASIQEKSNIIYKQPEDEIAAVNMAIGASFAGVRSMTATSGGGFALMVEATSLAAMTETPLVIVYGMRPGPATGLPTWTGQSDLPFILHAGHGEFSRIVLAPGDIEEAFYLTMQAFNLADRYQTPVFIVGDKHLFESRCNINPDIFLQYASTIPVDRGKLLTEEIQNNVPDIDRYELTDDGISPRPLPGRKGGVFRVNSDEHTPDGYSTEDAVMAKKMVDKRMMKQEIMQKELGILPVIGPEDADVLLISWGSTKGALTESITYLNSHNDGHSYSGINLNWLNPFPREQLTVKLHTAKKVICIEGARNGPLKSYIHEQTGYLINNDIKKYDGRPLYPEDIIEGVQNYVRNY